MAAAFISLGSNIAPEENLRRAVEQLHSTFGEVLVSPVYRSAAVGFDGPEFLNAVAMVETGLPASDIAERLLQIENQCLRDRTQPRFSSRTLDLDLLMVDQLIVTTDTLTLPRAEILEEAFVLRPLADIAGSVLHPVAGVTIEKLWRCFQLADEGAKPAMTEVELAL